jgi:hypothetical protein
MAPIPIGCLPEPGTYEFQTGHQLSLGKENRHA